MDPLDHINSDRFSTDSVVEEVRQKFADRAAKGYKKYNANGS